MWVLRFVTLRCRNFSFIIIIIIFQLIGMAYQLILSSVLDPPPHPLQIEEWEGKWSNEG